ncbi:MAG: MGMT family protein [Candidatus Omnitrophica bacterium]|nr:MGMT family protein [Candidatus Omnitrophota bacterium]
MRRRHKILSAILSNKWLSEFEKKVYIATLDIPKGQTRTYKWVAERVGRPKSFRAVGNSLNKNPYSPDVPCHRVIRSDGSLGGFARGSAVKRRLLRLEGIDL